MIALIASAIVYVGCSQEDRDEIVERGGNAISALKGETTPGEKTPRIVKEQQRKERAARDAAHEAAEEAKAARQAASHAGKSRSSGRNRNRDRGSADCPRA